MVNLYYNMCACAFIFDGLRGYCLEMWNALSMCMVKAAGISTQLLHMCIMDFKGTIYMYV